MAAKRKKRSAKSRRNVKGSRKTKQAPISLCMIVKNEERFLSDCLKSVVDLVSEIVIVDTGSNDRTIEIAKAFNARVFQIEWENDFAKARNFGLKKATHPWILYLDADERLHPHFHPLIREAVSSTQYDAYYLRVRSEVHEILGKVPHIQAYPRLFRKKPGVYFVGRIHEQITPSIQKQNGRFALLNVEIEHLGYDLTQDEMRAKVQRNLESLKKQVSEEPENAYARFQLGQTLIIAEHYEKGKYHLQKVLDNVSVNDSLRATVTLILANEKFKEQAYEEAIEMINSALKMAPRQRLGWFLLSECFAKMRQFNKAVKSLQKYLEYVGIAFSDISIDKIFEPYFIYQRLGIYHYFLDEHALALAHFQKYFETAPTFRTDLLIKFLYSLQQLGLSGDKLSALLENFHNQIEKFDNGMLAIQNLLAFCANNHLHSLFQKLLTLALSLYPEEASFHYSEGNLFFERGELNRAEDCYNRALKYSREHYEVFDNLAIIAIKKQDFEKAIGIYKEIHHKFPEQHDLVNRRLAGLYMKIGDVNTASKYAAAPQLKKVRKI